MKCVTRLEFYQAVSDQCVLSYGSFLECLECGVYAKRALCSEDIAQESSQVALAWEPTGMGMTKTSGAFTVLLVGWETISSCASLIAKSCFSPFSHF